jgi:hypothetical protein
MADGPSTLKPASKDVWWKIAEHAEYRGCERILGAKAQRLSSQCCL